MGNNIFEVMERNKFSYKSIREKSIVSLLDEKEYTINILIGFRGRPQFWNAITESFEQAFKYYNDKFPERGHSFCLTFVEHSEKPDGQTFFQGRTNYIWTPGPDWNKLYNRSFAYNAGVLWGNKADYYLLHDLDILVRKDFFVELYENLIRQNYPSVMQPYGKCVWYLNQELAQKVLNKEVDYNAFNETTPGVSPPLMDPNVLNSKGGSLLVSRELFYESGGLNCFAFGGYAAEDQFYWSQLETLLSEMYYARNPMIRTFHLWHEPAYSSNPQVWDMDDLFKQFYEMNKINRMKIINTLKERLSQ